MKKLVVALAVLGLAAPAFANSQEVVDADAAVLTDAELDAVSAGSPRNKIKFVLVQANVSKNTQIVKGSKLVVAAQANMTGQANVAEVVFAATQVIGGGAH